MAMNYSSTRRLSQARMREFTLVEGNWQYRNREDKTTLAPNILVEGSQNVVTNVYNRIGIVKGYTLDGQKDTMITPILSSFDYEMHTGETRHLRSYMDTTTNKGVLQYRYVDGAGVVTWRDLKIDLTNSLLRYTDFWDVTYFQTRMLFVDGTPNIYEWTGGIMTVDSVAAATITKTGTKTWAEEGFAFSGSDVVTINGVDYTYIGGADTVTLTGVTPTPVGSVIAGDIAHQAVVTHANSTLTDISATFNNYIIATLKNRIYLSGIDSREVYMSKIDDWTSFHYSDPRLPDEGYLMNLDAVPTAMKAQEDVMYISAGQDQWYEIVTTLSADLTNEDVTPSRLKTATGQASQTQESLTHDKNSIVYLSNEPILSSLGRVANILQTPQITDLSFPIINDFNAYDFDDCAVKYFKNFIYVAIPKLSIVRIYNQTDPQRHFWEAPVGYPISRFSVIDGELYGHSYATPQTFKLFNGYSFNGAPIDARAVFAFNPHGLRTNSKSCDEYFVEGYITQNGILNLGIQYNLDGCATNITKKIDGNDKQIVCMLPSVSLGKAPLGKNPLGGQYVQPTNSSVPANFRVIKTFNRTPFYLEQTSFTSSAVDFHWELVCFGTNTSVTDEGNNDITE